VSTELAPAHSCRPAADPLHARSAGRAGLGRIIALCNQKGGVGKTTTTLNTGACLAEAGMRVLVVDLDPQGALSVGLGINPMGLDLTVHDLLVRPDTATRDAVRPTSVPGLFLLPANIDLAAAEVQLLNEEAREHALARVLAPVRDDYDYILVDCQPSLGLLVVNALTAADGLVIPLECEYFALRGVALLLDTVRKVQAGSNPSLELTGVAATMYDARSLHGQEVMARLTEKFGDRVFRTTVGRAAHFPEATVAGEPITAYAPCSPGAAAYRSLAREIHTRFS
jgi:chromosome partitioning protein